MKILLSRLFLLVLLPLIDIYLFKKLKKFFPKVFKSKLVVFLYWLISFLIIGMMMIFSLVSNMDFITSTWDIFTGVVIVLLAVYIPKFLGSVTFLISEILRRITGRSYYSALQTKIITTILVAILLISEVIIIKAVVYDRFNFKIYEENIEFVNLPQNFDNYRIVHLSDLHLGSFKNHKNKVEEVVELVNNQNPDLIVFTGDLVNNVTDEAWYFFDILSELKSKDGIIAVTGNHDYGTYVSWADEKVFDNNFKSLIHFYDSLGAKLLLNQNVQIKRGNESVFITGIESSGKPPFEERGNVQKSLKGIPKNAFVIMLSHDPSFWKSNILDYKNIRLTLAGHTHSMQIGLYSELLNIRWSPIKYIYPEWHGVYNDNGQKLIINSGVGHIAMNARFGAPPEIGVVNLNVKRH